MNVILLRDCKYGVSGDVVTHSGAWRLAFPVKGCVGRPGDVETLTAVESELATVTGSDLSRVLSAMTTAGTYPVTFPKEESTVVQYFDPIELPVAEVNPVQEITYDPNAWKPKQNRRKGGQ